MACKTNRSKKPIKKTENTIKDSIKIFSVSHDSLYLDKTSFITKFNESINDICINSEERSNKYYGGFDKEKRFQKLLARDFKNKNFIDIKQLLFSFVKVKTGNTLSSQIIMEEWIFKNKEIAKSCFDSFEGYEEKEIYFKVVNWIWFWKDNRLFLLFSYNELVKDKPMQILKQRLMSFLDLKKTDVKEVYF